MLDKDCPVCGCAMEIEDTHEPDEEPGLGSEYYQCPECGFWANRIGRAFYSSRPVMTGEVDFPEQ